MLNTLQAKDAYGAARPAMRTPRVTEFDLFAQITSDLSRAAENTDDFAGLADALNRNRKLWTHLAIDLAAPENALPDALRADLLSLADFTMKHTSQVMRGEGDATPLIDINKSIMRGLTQKVEAA